MIAAMSPCFILIFQGMDQFYDKLVAGYSNAQLPGFLEH